LLALLERQPRKLAAVALANKMARIVWAKLAKVPADRLRLVGMPAKGMMAIGEAYRGNNKVVTQAAGVAVGCLVSQYHGRLYERPRHVGKKKPVSYGRRCPSLTRVRKPAKR